MHNPNIAKYSEDIDLFNYFSSHDTININEVEKILDKTPDSSFLYWKDENSKYKGCNMGFSNFQNMQSPSDIINISDHDFIYLETNRGPEQLIKEDKACMKGVDTKYPCGIVPVDKKTSLLFQHRKLPLLSAKKPIGVIALSLNITNTFLNLKENIVEERILLPSISHRERLSPKELMALRLYNQGIPRKVAAAKLNIAESTYAWYLREIRSKFGIRTRAEMLMLEQHYK